MFVIQISVYSIFLPLRRFKTWLFPTSYPTTENEFCHTVWAMRRHDVSPRALIYSSALRHIFSLYWNALLSTSAWHCARIVALTTLQGDCVSDTLANRLPPQVSALKQSLYSRVMCLRFSCSLPVYFLRYEWPVSNPEHLLARYESDYGCNVIFLQHGREIIYSSLTIL